MEELRDGIYKIPEGHKVLWLKDKKIQVVPYTNLSKPFYNRCKDCKHLKIGKKSMRNQFWDSTYCELLPKSIGGKQDYFYARNPSHIACNNNFEPKGDEMHNV